MHTNNQVESSFVMKKRVGIILAILLAIFLILPIRPISAEDLTYSPDILKSELEAATAGSTVTMRGNVSYGMDTIQIDKKVILDFNDFRIHHSNYDEALFSIAEGGELILINAEIHSPFEIFGENHGVLRVQSSSAKGIEATKCFLGENRGQVFIENANFKITQAFIEHNQERGKLHITNGNYALYKDFVGVNKGMLEIKDGKFTTSGYFLKHNDTSGKILLHKGYYRNEDVFINENDGQVSVMEPEFHLVGSNYFSHLNLGNIDI